MANRLTVRLEVWRHSSNIFPSDFADSIKDKITEAWGGASDWFRWSLWVKDIPAHEDEENVMVEIQFKHKELKRNDPREQQFEAIKGLWSTLLDPSSQLSLSRIPNEGDIGFKPVSRGQLTQADIDFGTTYCVTLIERKEWNSMFDEIQRPSSTFVIPADVLTFFEHLANALDNVWKDTDVHMVANEEDSVRVDRVVTTLKFAVSFWYSLDRWVPEALESLTEEAEEAVATLRGINAQNEISVNDMENTMMQINTVLKIAGPLYKVSKKHQDAKTSKIRQQGIKTVLAACFTASMWLIPIPGLPAAAWVIKAMRVAGAAGTLLSGGMTGKSVMDPDYYALRKVNKAIFDVGSNSHRIRRFMTLYYMHSKGLINDNDEKFMNFANEMAKAFTGVDVIHNWRDDNYVKSWLDTETGRLSTNIEQLTSLKKSS